MNCTVVGVRSNPLAINMPVIRVGSGNQGSVTNYRSVLYKDVRNVVLNVSSNGRTIRVTVLPLRAANLL